MPERRSPAARAVCAALLLLFLSAAPALAADEPPRVVILGFDGADPHLVQRYMDEGRLPHLKELREQGTFAPLLPTNPPQTPVSWAAFSTGLNPGRTGIFDFLYRKQGSYMPDFARATAGKTRRLFG